jgi:hypothetical protein
MEIDAPEILEEEGPVVATKFGTIQDVDSESSDSSDSEEEKQ